MPTSGDAGELPAWLHRTRRGGPARRGLPEAVGAAVATPPIA